MTPTDLELIDQLIAAHPELERLVQKHSEYESRLEQIASAKWQSPGDYYEERRLKALKLAGRDRIAGILEDHRARSAASA